MRAGHRVIAVDALIGDVDVKGQGGDHQTPFEVSMSVLSNLMQLAVIAVLLRLVLHDDQKAGAIDPNTPKAKRRRAGCLSVCPST